MENKITNKLDIKITQEMINDYAEASKDYNPIHIDEEFASKSLFGSTWSPKVPKGVQNYLKWTPKWDSFDNDSV